MTEAALAGDPAAAPARGRACAGGASPASGGDALVARILDAVAARCGARFHGYRRAMVERRIRNRMSSAGVPDLASYAALLDRDPREAARLLGRLTLKVSRLWRNADAVAAVAAALARGAMGTPRRAWSAGCARGEEAFTLAMLLADAPGGGPWSVVGTDVDPEALADAARARYGPPALAELPDAVLRRHLGPPDAGGLRGVRDPLRAGVRFAAHDLVASDAPPAGAPFEVVACRNVLIYLEAAARRRVERLLLAALAPGALLWLGEAEWPSAELQAGIVFEDRRARLFRRREGRP